MQTTLPQPNADAIAHSLALSEKIHQAIQLNDGWINFADFMHLALYEPGLGYYSGGAKKFGFAGDFVTAPEISPLFAKTIANQVTQVIQALNIQNIQSNVLELGAGTGRLAKDLLLALHDSKSSIQHYFILEVSAYLREVQQEKLKAELPAELFEKVVWLDKLPKEFSGFVLANEVLDALPIHIVKRREQGFFEMGVVSDTSQFLWQEKPLKDVQLTQFVEALNLSENYAIEVC
ncbi:MAG: class I SAM-dependent methyltransferase, partial [Proteobacteria bacterium]|nr:class I SAM-dependent methyltransferase [Pseudomonadota bacterium]